LENEDGMYLDFTIARVSHDITMSQFPSRTISGSWFGGVDQGWGTIHQRWGMRKIIKGGQAFGIIELYLFPGGNWRLLQFARLGDIGKSALRQVVTRGASSHSSLSYAKFA